MILGNLPKSGSRRWIKYSAKVASKQAKRYVPGTGVADDGDIGASQTNEGIDI
jgi:hypothetical protein